MPRLAASLASRVGAKLAVHIKGYILAIRYRRLLMQTVSNSFDRHNRDYISDEPIPARDETS